MKTVNLPVTFQNYSIPPDILMNIPSPDGKLTQINVPLSSLPIEALDAIVEQFAKDLFTAAGRSL